VRRIVRFRFLITPFDWRLATRLRAKETVAAPRDAMAVAYFNGAEPSDVDAFEAMRRDGDGIFADDASAVRAVWRGATGRAACSEMGAQLGGPDPSFWHEYDARGCCMTCGHAYALPCQLCCAPVAYCASTVSSRRAAEERVVLTERRAYRTHWNAIKLPLIGFEPQKYEWELQWRAIDLERLSDARRVKPWCFCLGGHDGFAVHVDDETAEFHNFTVRSAGMLFSQGAHLRTTPQYVARRGGVKANAHNVELGKKYPPRDAFRFSSSSPDEAVALLAEVMRAATPQVMTKARA
jgi:hypothetical protein